jgi:hypothetical protein
MKYYVYVSETKLEMLYEQIGASTEQASEASVGFDLKLVKGELKQSRQLADTKYSRLDRVVAELRESQLVGSLSCMEPYISGELDMVWASFGLQDNSPITFWGFVNDDIALGLAGSQHHIIGERRPEGYAHSHSGTGEIMRWFARELGDVQSTIQVDVQELLGADQWPLDDDSIAYLTWLAASQIHGSTHRFEFVAKVLHRRRYVEGTSPNYMANMNVILATPLYVAQAD